MVKELGFNYAAFKLEVIVCHVEALQQRVLREI
jgi:hypothetical protein